MIKLSISRLLVPDCCNFNSCSCVIASCAAFVLVTCAVIFLSVSYKSKSKSDLTSKSHSEVLFKISKPLFANRCFEYFKKFFFHIQLKLQFLELFHDIVALMTFLYFLQYLALDVTTLHL